MYGEIAALQEAIQEIVADAREAKTAGDLYDVLYDVQHHAKDLQEALRQLSDIEADLESRLECPDDDYTDCRQCGSPTCDAPYVSGCQPAGVRS